MYTPYGDNPEAIRIAMTETEHDFRWHNVEVLEWHEGSNASHLVAPPPRSRRRVAHSPGTVGPRLCAAWHEDALPDAVKNYYCTICYPPHSYLLLLQVEQGNQHEVWVMLPASKERIEAVRGRRISVRDAFLQPEGAAFLEVHVRCPDPGRIHPEWLVDSVLRRRSEEMDPSWWREP